MTTTPLNTLDRSLIEDALELINAEPDALITDYSGRCMFGATCLGVVLPAYDTHRFTATLAALMTLADPDNGLDQVSHLFSDVRQDNMGRDTILYFPDWNVAE